MWLGLLAEEEVMQLDMHQILERMAVSSELEQIFAEALESRDTPAYWHRIRDLWAVLMPKVMEGEYEPYFVDWTLIFTPIERAVWTDIRSAGLKFHPQIPVGRRFIDFGDPVKKIGIECDGSAFHVLEKDIERDKELLEHGWTVYHLKGRECLVGECPDDWDSFEGRKHEIRQWMTQSAGGLIRAIADKHYGRKAYPYCTPYIDEALTEHLLIETDHG
jgi:hypothetical protein